MSMVQPSERQELNQMLMMGMEEKKVAAFEEQLSKERRGTIDSKDFYEERPHNAIFLETSKEQDERVRRNSPFGQLKTWRLIKLIVKSNDDVRQEQFAMQLIS
jgi:phosphatidylinositol kinase/protein kinase (PI-3  family)